MRPKIIPIVFAMLLTSLTAHGQQEMNLSEVIHTARNQSVEALEAKQAFISTYWAFRSYQASRLPSFYMYGNLMNGMPNMWR